MMIVISTSFNSHILIDRPRKIDTPQNGSRTSNDKNPTAVVDKCSTENCFQQSVIVGYHSYGVVREPVVDEKACIALSSPGRYAALDSNITTLKSKIPEKA